MKTSPYDEKGRANHDRIFGEKPLAHGRGEGAGPRLNCIWCGERGVTVNHTCREPEDFTHLLGVGRPTDTVRMTFTPRLRLTGAFVTDLASS